MAEQAKTPADIEAIAKNIAGTAEKIVAEHGSLKAGLEELKKSLDGKVGDIDVKALATKVEAFKAQIDKITEEVLNGGIGLGKDAKREGFSVLRACVAVSNGSWDAAPIEKKYIEAARVQRSAITGIDSQGGVWIPEELIADFVAPLYHKSAFVALNSEGTTRIRVIDNLRGSPARFGKGTSGCVAYWLNEGEEYIESMLSAGTVNMTPKKLTVLVLITDEMKRFQSPGYNQALLTDMSQATAQKLDYTIMYGTGSDSQPLGLVSQKGVRFFSAKDKAAWTTAPVSNTGGELTFDDMDEIQGLLEDNKIPIDPSAAFIFSPKFKRRLKKIKIQNFSGQTTGQPYLIGAPRIPDSKLAEYIGPFGTSTQIVNNIKPNQHLIPGGSLDTSTKSTDVFYGNWNDVLLGRWSGIEIEDDGGKGKGFTKGLTYMKLTTYADIGYRRPESIVACGDAFAADS